MSKSATVRQEEIYKAMRGLSSEINILTRNIVELRPQSVCPLYDAYTNKIEILSAALTVLATEAKNFSSHSSN